MTFALPARRRRARRAQPDGAGRPGAPRRAARPDGRELLPVSPARREDRRRAACLAARAARARPARAAAAAGAAAARRERTARRRGSGPGLSARVWLAAFVGDHALYVVHLDADGGASSGRFSRLSPLLHSYALPVFAVLAVLVAVRVAVRPLAPRRRGLRRRHARPGSACPHRGPARRRGASAPDRDAAPRRRFGLAFESRPPPLAA